MTDGGRELETSPETASYRHYRRQMWQTLRVRYADAAIAARGLGMAEDEAGRVAARALRGELRAFMAELLVRAPVPALLEFLAEGRDWGVAGERLLQREGAVLELIDSAYPRPTWTGLAPLGREAAEDDAAWASFTAAWTAALGPVAQAALQPSPAQKDEAVQEMSPRRWAPWLVSAAAVIGATAVIAVATRE